MARLLFINLANFIGFLTTEGGGKGLIWLAFLARRWASSRICGDQKHVAYFDSLSKTMCPSWTEQMGL